ncbi:MAG: tRNA epoxyqueuosine(34) reductase QueG [Bacteroidales bacterium]|nr:tRNA epoxyqueuosine(34) reductase QueG [Bacteroidales bacterium]
MTPAEQIKQEAISAGFSHCGIARAGSLEELHSFYSGYFRENKQASLSYLKRNHEKRMDPSLLLREVKSIIALSLNYFPREIIPQEDNFILAKYTYGADYHVVLKNRMKQMTNRMKALFGNFKVRPFVDSGVIAEKVWAQRCGLGWQGKNSVLINKTEGSFFFIGILLTDLDLEPDIPGKGYCGTCEKCVHACPTGALDNPYQLNVTRCISYYTIENATSLPDNIKDHLNNRIYGCDICQDVCPFNQSPKPHQIPEFIPHPLLQTMRKKDWLSLTQQQFDGLFKNSPIKRIGYQQLMRNIKAAGTTRE